MQLTKIVLVSSVDADANRENVYTYVNVCIINL